MKLLPLIEPTTELTTEQKQRYARHFTLPGIGTTGQRRLANAKILSIGAGGLGSPILLYLAAAGVGTLGIIDADTVDTSNLQRQIIHTNTAIGQPKITSAAQTIKHLSPATQIATHHQQITCNNATKIISSYDLVIDGSDNFATRYTVNDACEAANKPLIWGTISQYTAQISLFWANPITPEGNQLGPTLRDLYPEIPPANSIPTCATGGVLGSLCGTAGSTMATEAIKLICGIDTTLLGKLWIYDARTQTTRTLTITPDPTRTPVPLTQTQIEIKQANQLPTEETTPTLSYNNYQQHPNSFTLIDVREDSERAAGHYPDTGNLPHRKLITTIENATNAEDLPKPLNSTDNTALVFYCASGTRSALVVRALAKAFPNLTAYSLDGGYRRDC